jgi:hypothetical protein
MLMFLLSLVVEEADGEHDAIPSSAARAPGGMTQLVVVLPAPK